MTTRQTMRIRTTRWAIRMVALAAALTAVTLPSAAAEPAFTYQGQLKQDGVPVTGEADFEFHLWDAETGGTELADDYFGGVSLGNGLFTVQLAFDAGLFDGSPRYLEVHVAVPSGGAFTPLAGRQPITPAPYALALPALRTEQDAISPNIIAGHGDNIITNGAHGVTLSGGGSAGMDSNAVTDHFGTIGGGARNRAGNNVGTTADATAATVGGGSYNQASAQYATIAGGHSNYATGVGSAIGGGSDNSASADRAAVGGGEENNATGAHAAIAGGSANNADGRYAAIGGGVDNIAGGQAGAVPGGRANRANGENSFAAGYRAQADHEATFVWSDATDTTFFTSTGPNQFLVNAAGGVGINTNAPGAALHIGGTPGADGLMFPDGSLQTTAATGGGAGDGHSLDASDGSPTDAVYVEASGRVRMNKGGLTVFDDAGHGISMTSDNFSFNEGTSEDPVYDYSSSTDTHVFYTNGTRQMIISPAGNVGIGMSFAQSPSAKLHIGGTAGADGLMFPDGTLQTTAAGGGGSSLWTPSASNIYYNTGNVGVGATTPAHALQVVSDGERAISGENDATSGAAHGVYGESGGTGGRGVSGWATASSGTTYGIFGRSYSTSGRGVYGNASAASGFTHGVSGQSWSSTGRGVSGLASATSGVNYGVYGETASPDGFAGYFVGPKNYFQGSVGIGQQNPQAMLHIGGTPDVDGIMFPDGTLQTTAATGGGSSLWTPSASDIYFNSGNVGVGTDLPQSRLHVVGADADASIALTVEGSGYLATGVSCLVNGAGAEAVHVVSEGATGIGVRGDATGTGETIGVYGVADSTSGRGTYGYATADSGVTNGAFGRARSPLGFGVYGSNSASTGDAIGVRGKTSSADGYAGYFTGGRNYFEGDVGIGVPAPAEKLDVAGTVKMTGLKLGTSATFGHVLTADTNGVGTWQAAPGGGGDSVWTESSGGIHYDSGNVSIGHPSPPTGMRLLVRGDEPVGIKSETTADGGSAVWGVATANSTNTIGVNGTAADSSDGIGVYGWGGNTGVKGESTSSSGVTYGVWGKSNSPSGTGVYGKHYATTGTGFGVYGITRSEDEWSAGVSGYASSTAISSLIDKTIGVSGFSQGGDGIGVYGQAMHSTTNHATYGGYFESVSNFGTGVYGEATHTSGINYGVRGVSSSPNGYAGYFKNTNLDGDGIALYAESAGAGATDATLRVNNTQANAGMAAYLTSVGSYATAHFQNDGTGEVLWLSKDNAAGGEFIVAINEHSGGRVFSVDDNGWTKVSVLEITGGADLSEQFDVSEQTEQVEPGMVMVIDADHPGKLALSDTAYDRKVAGVLSGAGGVKPGMLMGQAGTIADGKHPVALTGRVWTWCDASGGAIRPGDLLTTSDVPGHAMKVADHGKAQGAMIGKAMTPLSDGTGLVLVLVSLQ